MKKLFGIFMAVIIGLSIISTSAFASAGKGARIFQRKLLIPCGFNAFIMAQKHTQAEWTKISEAGKLNETMENLCKTVKPFKASDEKHVSEFFYAFASDSGKVVAG